MIAASSCGGEGPFHPERSLPPRWARQHDEIRAALRSGRPDRALALLCEHAREYGCDANTLLAGCAHEEGNA